MACDITYQGFSGMPVHPNGMQFYALDDSRSVISEALFYSIGGGAIIEPGKWD